VLRKPHVEPSVSRENKIFPDERTGCSAFVGKLLGNFLYAASGMLLEIFFYITETNQLSLMVVKQLSH
jgi:hypothetical protein